MVTYFFTPRVFQRFFEIIIADDGSTDNSVDIIKSYNLNNLKIFSLASNSGPSAARNLGLKNSIGEYVYFFDVEKATKIKILLLAMVVIQQKQLYLIKNNLSPSLRQ